MCLSSSNHIIYVCSMWTRCNNRNLCFWEYQDIGYRKKRNYCWMLWFDWFGWMLSLNEKKLDHLLSWLISFCCWMDAFGLDAMLYKRKEVCYEWIPMYHVCPVVKWFLLSDGLIWFHYNVYHNYKNIYKMIPKKFRGDNKMKSTLSGVNDPKF